MVKSFEGESFEELQGTLIDAVLVRHLVVLTTCPFSRTERISDFAVDGREIDEIDCGSFTEDLDIFRK